MKTLKQQREALGVVDSGRQHRPIRYQEARPFLEELRRQQPHMTAQEYRTIKGQALAGDINGAWKGLILIRERNAERRQRR